MQISKVSFNQYNQNFGRVYKEVGKYVPEGSKMISFVSEAGKLLGRQISKANGDVEGWRNFSRGYRISYDTSHGTLFKDPYVVMEYRHPINRKEKGRRLLVFDLDKFKENMQELTTLKGIKGYFAKIERAPKETRFEPCC